MTVRSMGKQWGKQDVYGCQLSCAFQNDPKGDASWFGSPTLQVWLNIVPRDSLLLGSKPKDEVRKLCHAAASASIEFQEKLNARHIKQQVCLVHSCHAVASESHADWDCVLSASHFVQYPFLAIRSSCTGGILIIRCALLLYQA